jgi:hypothetical protein
MVVAFILLFVQLNQAPAVVQRFGAEITVPHGWTARDVNESFAMLEHTSGATLLVTKARPAQEFRAATNNRAERIANPLGFATIGTPRHFKNPDQEWFEYDIRGNRLADRRRILYRAVVDKTGLTEIVFETPEGRYDALISEALAIAISHKSIRREVRMRK